MSLCDVQVLDCGRRVMVSSDESEVDLGVLPFDESLSGRVNFSVEELTFSGGIQRITNELNVQFINLKTITLPASMKEISSSVFAGSIVKRIGISNDSNESTLFSPIHCALSLLLKCSNSCAKE